uniref:alcohol dehydrogenase n=1 Tax=Panagrellus redivivus TaxID=6233 RepID=A0A7E4UV95_PANRE
MSENVPILQKAAVYSKIADPIEICDIPVPELSSTDVLVKILYSGLGKIDMDIWAGNFPIEPEVPRVGGHCGVGVVVQVGADVSHFKPGDRAGIKLINDACLCCEFCKRGSEAHCESATTTGLGINGTWQQYFVIKYSEVVRIPESLQIQKAVPILSDGVTAYRALKESNVKPGQIIAITSAGSPLGRMGIQYAKAMGMRVIAIDSGNANSQICKDLGATIYIDTNETTDLVQSVINATDGGPNGVLCIDTTGDSIELATMYVRTRGMVVLLTLPKDTQLTADVFWTVFRGVTIKGSFYGNRQDGDEALDFAARGIIDVQVETLPMEFLPKLCDQMSNAEITRRIVIDNWK